MQSKLSIALFLWILATWSAYDAFLKAGDDLLDKLQSGDDEIFVVTFFNPTPKMDDYSRQYENKRVMENLVSEVLHEQNDKPLRVNHAYVDVTDRENDNLLYKTHIEHDMVDQGPVVLASRKGHGFHNWGPTVLHRVAEVIELLQAQAKEDLEANSSR